MPAKIDDKIFITVRLLGFLSKWAGIFTPQVEIPPGLTIDQLLQQLAVNCGDEFRAAIWDSSGRLHGGIELLLNGQVISPSQIREVNIYGNSELVLIPVIAGGWQSILF